jgi:hypothetical protein
MFEQIRESFRHMLASASAPGDRRAVLAEMKETLVRARLGVDDLRGGVAASRAKLDGERRELETVRRRLGLAQQIGDAETVRVAERFEKHHLERVQVLEEKLAVQERELSLVEAEVAEMTAEFRSAMVGAGPRPAAAAQVEDPLEDEASRLRDELDGLARSRTRSTREAEADDRLADLKRRMGK